MIETSESSTSLLEIIKTVITKMKMTAIHLSSGIGLRIISW